ARGFMTVFTHDAFGNRTSVTDPLGDTHTFAYDGAGNLSRRTDANGKTTVFSYDARNRLRSIDYPNSTQASFAYDANNNLVSIKDENTDLAYDYDANNRLIQEKDNKFSKRLVYQYDGIGNRVSMTGPEGEPIAYQHDLAGRLSTITRGEQQFHFFYDDG